MKKENLGWTVAGVVGVFWLFSLFQLAGARSRLTVYEVGLDLKTGYAILAENLRDAAAVGVP